VQVGHWLIGARRIIDLPYKDADFVRAAPV
jgi:hypothetical protein